MAVLSPGRRADPAPGQLKLTRDHAWFQGADDQRRTTRDGGRVRRAGVLLVGASSASASQGDVTCSGAVTQDVPHNLIVPAGGFTCLITPGVLVGHDVI